MRSVIVFVLGGGRGVRLYPLTKYRSKPAAPLAGEYRLIDIPLSNCINSGMNRIYVLTQFMSVSLHRHIRQTYRFDQFNEGFVELLAAQQTMDAGNDWYQGTADAVRKNLSYIEQPGVDYVLILSGDQLYRMDYREMIATHEANGADVTIAAIPVGREDASQLGLMKIDESGRVNGFVEKPKTPEALAPVLLDPKWIDERGIRSKGRECLANMGIYLFQRDLLVELLKDHPYEDFGKEVFPATIGRKRVQVHLFDGYWEDVGTIRAFYDANLSLTRPDPPFSLMSPDAPIYTHSRFLPPSKLAGATVVNSLIAEGCRIGRGSVIENSIVGLRATIGENVLIKDSVLMGADFYETDAETALHGGEPPIGVGDGSVVREAILDKNARIGKGVVVYNEAKIENSADADDCMIRDGVPVVIKNAVLPDGWKLAERIRP